MDRMADGLDDGDMDDGPARADWGSTSASEREVCPPSVLVPERVNMGGLRSMAHGSWLMALPSTTLPLLSALSSFFSYYDGATLHTPIFLTTTGTIHYQLATTGYPVRQ